MSNQSHHLHYIQISCICDFSCHLHYVLSLSLVNQILHILFEQKINQKVNIYYENPHLLINHSTLVLLHSGLCN